MRHHCGRLEIGGGGEHFSNNSQGLEWWFLHACVDLIQFLTSFSASAAASASATSASATSAASAASAASARTTVQTVRRQSSGVD